jgi:hypothetical protein
MRSALENPEIVKRSGNAARQRALEVFAQQRMVREHLELYWKLTPTVDGAEESGHFRMSP